MDWYRALAGAGSGLVAQLATIEPSSCAPRVRSVIHRAFILSPSLPTLPLILCTTDIRTPKVSQLASERRVELVYWVPKTQEQFRILGRASIVPSPRLNADPYPYPPPRGIVYDALAQEGFDWEKKRIEVFDTMSGPLKATWCWPPSGTPLGSDGEEEMKKWPQRLPKLGEADGEEEERNLEKALGNFALLLVEPVEVDYVELGVQPFRRRRFERDWEDERVVEFKTTLVVP